MKKLSLEKQDSFVRHQLAYELWMMNESLAAAKQPAPLFQHNLYVEGFALHARNLIEFLGTGKYVDPADFTTEDFSVDRNFICERLVRKINEQISHLTSARTQNQNEKFCEAEWEETAKAIKEEFERWTKNLKPDWAEKWEQRERIESSGPNGPLSADSSSRGSGATAGPGPLTGNEGPRD